MSQTVKSEALSKFFSGKALLELKNRGLSLQQINSDLLQHGQTEVKGKTEESKKPSGETKLDRKKNLVKEILWETIETITTIPLERPSGENFSEYEVEKRADFDNGQVVAQTISDSTNKKIVLIHLEELFNHFEAEMQETVAMKVRKDEKIASLKKSTRKLGNRIQSLKRKLESNEIKIEEKVCTKKEHIESVQVNMELAKTKNDIEISDCIREANIKIISETGTILAQLKDFDLSLKTAEAQFEEKQRNMLTDVQKLKDQKLKAEQALQTALLKFDNDVGSLATELEKVRKEISTDKKNFEAWRDTFAKQQKIEYENMMLEKAEDERLEIVAKIKELRERRLATAVIKKWKKFVKMKNALKSMTKKGKNKRKR